MPSRERDNFLDQRLKVLEVLLFIHIEVSVENDLVTLPK